MGTFSSLLWYSVYIANPLLGEVMFSSSLLTYSLFTLQNRRLEYDDHDTGLVYRAFCLLYHTTTLRPLFQRQAGVERSLGAERGKFLERCEHVCEVGSLVLLLVVQSVEVAPG